MIASGGVYINCWVTLHGIAINLDAGLTPSSLINPCGLVSLEMTSVSRETGRPAPIDGATRDPMPPSSLKCSHAA
jgi:lipoate-protein ligase B